MIAELLAQVAAARALYAARRSGALADHRLPSGLYAEWAAQQSAHRWRLERLTHEPDDAPPTVRMTGSACAA